MHSPTGDMLEYLLSFANHLNQLDSDHMITVMLMDLGINESRMGFEYLKAAIRLFMEEPAQMITKGLYPAVASRCGHAVSGEAVERAIRGAIKAAWKSHGGIWAVYFPGGRKPSNSLFIAKIAKYIELWEGCCVSCKQRAGEEVLQHDR